MTRCLTTAVVALSALGAARESFSEDAAAGRAGYRRETLHFKTTSGEERTRQLDLWYPTESAEERYNYRFQIGSVAHDAGVAPGKHPLVLFSHGFLGASDQSIFLMEACARSGYVIASMNHADAIVEFGRRPGDSPNFADSDKWTDAKYLDRQEDLKALLEEMLRRNQTDGSLLKEHLDSARIAGVGHSLGGYTMLGMIGGWKSWKEPRIKAAVLLSPYANPYPANGDLDHVTIPVMIQGGTLDFGITPFLRPVYDKLAGPKVFLILKGENHFGWTNFATLKGSTTEVAAQGNPELIVTSTIAFLDQHLRGLDRSDVLKKLEPRLFSCLSDDAK